MPQLTRYPDISEIVNAKEETRRQMAALGLDENLAIMDRLRAVADEFARLRRSNQLRSE